MQQIGNLFSSIEKKEPQYKNWRDELVSQFVDGINSEREKAGWEYTKNGKLYKLGKITKKEVALKLNRNPFLKGSKNDGEVYNLLRECQHKGFKKFFWVCK